MEDDSQSNDCRPLRREISYYSIPIELIKVIHWMCEPEEFGELRIADARLYHGPHCSVPHGEVDAEYFTNYKQSRLVTMDEENNIFGYRRIYTTFRGKNHGEFKCWHYNGQLYRQAFYVHGKLHGKHEEWFNTGQLSLRVFYVNDKCEGEFKRWHANGQLHTSVIYVHGKCEGDYQKWHENGQLHSIVFYIHGNREGEYHQWHDNGQPQVRSLYVDDLLNGDYKYWNRDGRLTSNCTYSDGVEIVY